MADLPTWNPRPYAGFREAENVDNRLDESFISKYRQVFGQMSIGELMALAKGEVPTRYITDVPAAPPLTPLAAQAGADDILSGHGAWILRRAMEENARIQNDPAIHSFDEKMDPAGPPVGLNRQKLPFGLGG